MEKVRNEENKVLLVGKVVSKKMVGTGVLRIILTINSPVKNGIRSDTATLMFFQDSDAANGAIRTGDRLKAIAMATTSFDRKQNRRRMTLAAREYEVLGFGDTTPDTNEFMVECRYTGRFIAGKTTILNLMNNEKPINVSCFGNIAQRAEKFTPGETVLVRGRVRSHLSNDQKYHETMVADFLDAIQ